MKAALGGRGPDYLVKGWQVSGTIFARTGFPYTVFDFAESSQPSAEQLFRAALRRARGSLFGSGIRAGKALRLSRQHPCQPPQVSRDDGTRAKSECALRAIRLRDWVQYRKLAGPIRSVRRPCCVVFPRTQSFSWAKLFQYRLRHHEEHENSRLGKCHPGDRVSVLQSLQPSQFWLSGQLQFRSRHSDRSFIWSNRLPASLAAVLEEMWLPG